VLLDPMHVHLKPGSLLGALYTLAGVTPRPENVSLTVTREALLMLADEYGQPPFVTLLGTELAADQLRVRLGYLHVLVTAPIRKATPEELRSEAARLVVAAGVGT
jgi:hypothetical protein